MTYIKVADYFNDEKGVYFCEKCEYSTSRLFNINKHLSTKKHCYLRVSSKSSTLPTHGCLYVCDCGKTYKHRQSLYTHKKTCAKVISEKDKGIQMEPKKDTQMGLNCEEEKEIVEIKAENKLLREINKLKSEMLELVKNQKIQFTNSITNSQINCNNKNEIKIFLSEHCANAISIQDFVRQLSISLDDLINAKDNSVLGITNIIERNLKPLTLTTRPVHCVEKDEWFLKDKEEWKEDDGSTLVDKTHTKIQRECLEKYNTDMSIVSDEQQIGLIAFATDELNNADKDKIKKNLLHNCAFKSK